MESITGVLQRLKGECGLVAIKAEFEAEGMSLDELAIYADLAYKSDIRLTIKIGGPNALRDFHEAWQVGASNILVPMVESPSALINAASLYRKCASIYEQSLGYRPHLLINIETIESVNSVSAIHEAAVRVKDILKGVVIGRTDLSSSMSSSNVNDPEVSRIGSATSRLFSDSSFDVTVGGGVDSESYESLANYFSPYITAYETRKCTLSWSGSISRKLFTKSTSLALLFEKMWIESLFEYQNAFRKSQLDRLTQINSRLGRS